MAGNVPTGAQPQEAAPPPTAPLTLFPAELCWLCSQRGCSPSHGDINIPHSFSASQTSCKAASEGRGKDTFELLPQSPFSGSQKQGRAFSQTAAAKAHPGALEIFGAGSSHVSMPGLAELTSWTVEEQGLFSGFKRGNYFSARPSQASSTHHLTMGYI